MAVASACVINTARVIPVSSSTVIAVQPSVPSFVHAQPSVPMTTDNTMASTPNACGMYSIGASYNPGNFRPNDSFEASLEENAARFSKQLDENTQKYRI